MEQFQQGTGVTDWRRGSVDTLRVLCLLIAAWLLSHPYRGIIHDARLYTAQALNALAPDRFKDDLYFKYGSQDSFTFFTYAYKPLIAYLEPGPANQHATLAGNALWLAALVLLMRTIFGWNRVGIIAILASILISPVYGGLGIFRYGEAFATPRVFAEALVLCSLATALQRRPMYSVAGLALAAAIHPLVALSGLMVLAIGAACRDGRILVLLALALLAAFLLSIASVEPLVRIWQTLDDEWFQIVKQRNGVGLLLEWRWSDWVRVAADCAVLGMAFVLGNEDERRIIGPLIAASCAGLALTLVGGDAFHNVLVINIQPWRILWLTSLAANAWLSVILLRYPSRSVSREMGLLAALFGVLSAFLPILTVAYPILLLATCLSMIWEFLRGQHVPVPIRLCLRALAAAALLILPVTIAHEIGSHGWLILLLRVALAACVIVLILKESERTRSKIGAALATLSLVVSLALYDQREKWSLFYEDQQVPASLAAFTENAGQVYWERGLEVLWFKLGRPSYYSCLQGAGLMFERLTAMDYERRSRILRALNTRDFEMPNGVLCMQKQDPGVWGPQTTNEIRTACERLPDLDTLILTRRIEGMPVVAWKATAPLPLLDADGTRTEIDTFYRYSCSQLR